MGHSKSKYRHDFEHFFHEEMGYKILADKEQYEYVTAILAPTSQVQAVFCDSPAGTGKTSIAMAAAYYRLLKNDNKKCRIIYVRNTLAVRENGFLPGTAEEKEAQFMKPAIENINRIGQSMNTSQDLFSSMLENEEIEVCSTSYLRGVDIEGEATIIIDEAQNLDITELQTVLTRIHDSVKVIVIGSTLQCDNTKLRTYGPNKLTPFELYMEHFAKQSIIPVEFITLKTNHRGKFANYADQILQTVNAVKDERKDKKEETIKVIPTDTTPSGVIYRKANDWWGGDVTTPVSVTYPTTEEVLLD